VVGITQLDGKPYLEIIVTKHVFHILFLLPLHCAKRFFKEDGSPSEDLLDIKTRHIIPVDLNSYLCKNAATMAKFHKMLGHTDAAKKYEEYFDGFVTAIDKVLWNAEKGAWFDFDTLHNKSNLEFYPSNVAPLWAECYS
jgi:alpha,alpha-trehalase